MESLYTVPKICLPKGVLYSLEVGVPELHNAYLWHWIQKIKPIITIDSVKYTLENLTCSAMRYQNYLEGIKDIQRLEEVKRELEELGDFVCVHPYRAPLSFEPHVGDVLSQIPLELFNQAQAFEIIEKPESLDDVYRYTKKHYHLSRVMTYKLR